jgi:glycosyltransferase involved in cell wall biosynthesis
VAGPRQTPVVDQRRVDLVHAHGLRAGWLASLVPRRRPLVVTVHNIVLDGVAGRSAGVLRQAAAVLPRRVDAVIATSAEVAAALAAGSAKVTVIPPVGPVPTPRRSRATVRTELGVAPDTPLVVAAGRLHLQKGFDTLLDAVPGLAASVPGVRVVVVGEGPDGHRLRRRVIDENLYRTISFAGASPNAADELAASDVVAITSIWESGPLVLLEAMELGQPVVTTPVGVAPQLVADGVTGRVVPIGDARALAGALASLLTDRGAAAELAAAGEAAVVKWLDRDALVDEVVDVYERVLSQ